MSSELVRQNAVIIDTFLGFEDHGFFTFRLTFDYGGSIRQSGGDIVLGNDDGIDPSAGVVIAAILKAADVGSWEKVKGKPVQVLRDEGYNGLVRGIAPFLDDPNYPSNNVVWSTKIPEPEQIVS